MLNKTVQTNVDLMYIQLNTDLASLDEFKLNKKLGGNLLDPSAFRYGYFYYADQNGALSYNSNNAYGCTGYIQAKSTGLITSSAGTTAQGLSSYAVFDKNKKWLRNGQNSDQYTYVSGDEFVVFVFRIVGDLNFANTKSVCEGTTYSLTPYTEYKPLADLTTRVTALELTDLSEISNGVPITYGSVSNFMDSPLILERNIASDYLVYGVTGTGNAWITSPLFVPKGTNLVHIKFKLELTKVGTTTGIDIYVANSRLVTGLFTKLQSITENGEYDITFDPAYYTVYQGYTQFYVWINNQNMVDPTDSISAKLTSLRVIEYDNSIKSVNISGLDAKKLFESTDSQITSLKSSVTDKASLVSPLGAKYEIGVSDAGAIVAIPIIPTSSAFFGNSLLAGFGYGMAASQSTKDYYYLITNYLLGLNPSFTSTRNLVSNFEGITDLANVDSIIQSEFISKLSGSENLVSIQLGDNVNTTEKLAVFPTSSLKLCKAIRAKCPNARVVWFGMWYGSTDKYNSIQNACTQTGCKFISIANLVISANQNTVGNLSKMGLATRTLTGVTNVVANTATNITVTFTIGSTSYNSTLDVTRYSLVSDTLTYTSEYYIISSTGVASHPNDLGFKAIANKFLYEMKLTTSLNYY